VIDLIGYIPKQKLTMPKIENYFGGCAWNLGHVFIRLYNAVPGHLVDTTSRCPNKA
jgi:hypothetical protein